MIVISVTLHIVETRKIVLSLLQSIMFLFSMDTTQSYNDWPEVWSQNVLTRQHSNLKVHPEYLLKVW